VVQAPARPVHLWPRLDLGVNDGTTTARTGRVSVLVVDDCDEARAALSAAVAHTAGFELAGAVSSGREALALLPRLDPELVLLDVRMSGMDGLETCRRIVDTNAQAVVVLVSAHCTWELPDRAASVGAAAVLEKHEVSPRRLSALWEARGGPAATEVPAP